MIKNTELLQHETYDLPSDPLNVIDKEKDVFLSFIADLISEYERHSKRVSFIIFNPNLNPYETLCSNLSIQEYNLGTIFGITFISTYNHPYDKITFCNVCESWKPFHMCEKCMKNNDLTSNIKGVLLCKRPYLNTYKTSIKIVPSCVPDYCPYVIGGQ